MITIDLTGKNALVTGGTRGIGAAIAEDFAAAGARVVLTGRDGDQAKGVADRIGHGATGIAYDAGAPGAGTALAEWLSREVGRLDILINNAAILKPHRIDRLNEAEFDMIFGVNVKAALFLCQALHPMLARSGAGGERHQRHCLVQRRQ